MYVIFVPRAAYSAKCASTAGASGHVSAVELNFPTLKLFLFVTSADIPSSLLSPLPRLFQKNSLWVTFAAIKIISKPSNLGVAFARLGRLTTAITEHYRHVPSIEGLIQVSFLPHPVWQQLCPLSHLQHSTIATMRHPTTHKSSMNSIPANSPNLISSLLSIKLLRKMRILYYTGILVNRASRGLWM